MDGQWVAVATHNREGTSTTSIKTKGGRPAKDYYITYDAETKTWTSEEYYRYDAYGENNPALFKKIPKDKLPKDQEPKEGMMLVLGTPDGQQIPARIAKIDDKDVSIDLNHPLAGKTLNFKIKVVLEIVCRRLTS